MLLLRKKSLTRISNHIFNQENRDTAARHSTVACYCLGLSPPLYCVMYECMIQSNNQFDKFVRVLPLYLKKPK